MIGLLDDLLQIAHVEQVCREHFDLALEVKDIVLNNAPTSHGSRTTLFRSDNHTLYALCEADGSLQLADIQGIIKSMGIKAEKYLPPHGDANYFVRFGRRTFKSVFPGRRVDTDRDTQFYQTLTPYSPALIRIAKVSGEVRQYNTIWQRWQRVIRFSYLHLRVM